MIVYWLFNEHCTDPTKHGYVGVTVEPDRRLQRHRRSKSFPKGFQMTTLFEGTETECLQKEHELRPDVFIGWNKVSGGGLPPSHKGKTRSPETRKRMAEGRKGMKFSDEHRQKLRIARAKQIRSPMSAETKQRISLATKGTPKTLTPEQKQAQRERASTLHLIRQRNR